MVSKESILNAETPEEIFENDDEKIKSLYFQLAKQYHPDLTADPNNKIVMQHLNNLYQHALQKKRDGIWNFPHKIQCIKLDGSVFEFPYLVKRDFELGTFYVGHEQILYLVNASQEKFFYQMLASIQSLHYQNRAMQQEFVYAIPAILSQGRLQNGNFFVSFSKQNDYFPLANIYEKGSLPSRHVAWIVSRLLNISCFLQYNGLVHNGITIDTCFFSPRNHSIALLGGWWYCMPYGEPLLGIIQELYGFLPQQAHPIGLYETDLKSIRHLANTVLNFSWGKRSFVPLDITEQELYKTN